MKSRAEKSGLVGAALALLACALIACAPAQIYPGPPRPIEELVVIVVESPSKISSLDGQSVSLRRAEILPGSHRLEFQGEFGELVAKGGVVVGERRSRPLLKMTCSLEAESMPAGLYTFSANAEIDQKSSGPDPSYRWQKTSVAPELVDTEGNEIAGLVCDETCRLRGRKRESNISRACEFEE